MHALEEQTRTGTWLGFEHRLKDRERLKEKISDRIEEKNRSPEEAVSKLPDAIRYTFQYEQSRYTQGVWADVVRMKSRL